MTEEIVEKTELDVSWPQFDIIGSRQQVNLFLAGQGSGKSFIGGIVSSTFIETCPKVHGFIGANTYGQLSDSTLKEIRSVWKKYKGWTEWTKDNPRGDYVVNLKPPSHFNTENHDYTTYRGKICFKQGTVIYIGSLENYEAHEGKQFGWAVLDETKDTREEAVKEVITGRLREHGMFVDSNGELHDTASNSDTGENYISWNPLYILTSPAKVEWLNEWFNLDEYATEIVQHIYSKTDYFVKDFQNKRITISSTYHNEKNLPATYIPNQIANLHSKLQDMLIYGNPFSTSGGEYYKCFDRIKNVIDVWQLVPGFKHASGRAYNSKIALHLSFDFNVHPYMTGTVWQIVLEDYEEEGKIKQRKKVYQVDEICLSNPRNTTADICKEFIRRYQGHDAGLFIYGDPEGKHEDTKLEKGENQYTIIVRALAQFRPSLRVASAAPPVVTRGNFENTVFENGYDGLEIWIHEKCVKSIADYTYLKEASDGTKLKEKVKDPDTDITYEKHGHTSDSGDYFICVAFAQEFAKYKAGGALPSAPKGGRKPASKSSY